MNLRLRYARAPWTRTFGLLGRRSYPPKTALVFEGCRAIHTWFMQMPIDVVFVDPEWRVVKAYERVGPWRFLSEPHASSVLELAAGEASGLGLAEGTLVTRS